MAASDNLAMEPWVYRPTTFADSWISEAFTRDSKALTLALQKSLASNNSSSSNNNNNNFDSADSDLILPFLNTFQPESTPTPTVSGVSGSDPESVAAPKRQRNPIPISGKVTKRKSRASKRTQTTFITADPANFRQMVQQVTGVRFSNGQVSCMPTIVKPEPQRPGGQLPRGGCLPTLDTSALLLDHQHQPQRQLAGPASAAASAAGAGGGGGPVGPVCFGPSHGEVAEGGGSFSAGAGGLGFDSFSSFPTLESWKVM